MIIAQSVRKKYSTSLLLCPTKSMHSKLIHPAKKGETIWGYDSMLIKGVNNSDSYSLNKEVTNRASSMGRNMKS